MFGFSWLKIGAGLGLLIIVGLFAFAIKSGIDKIDAQGRKIATLERDLKSEQAARRRDVAGLTSLSQGIIAASSARALDETVLRETIDAKNPQPVSPGLGAFLDGLRRQGSPAGIPPAAPSARPAPAR